MIDNSKTGTVSDSPAFVAGATGFTGREVVRILCERGVPTIAHVRPDSSGLEEWTERFNKIGAEIDTTAWEEDAIAETMERIKPGFIFALLGTTRARMKGVARAGGDPKTASYEAVDYGMTSMLIKAAKASGTSPRFVFLSAAGVNSRAKSSYYAVRYEAEQELVSSGLPCIIARVSFITGPGRDDRRLMERGGAFIADLMFFLAGLLGARKFKARYSSNTNIILAGALVRLALDPSSANRIYESEDLRISS